MMSLMMPYNPSPNPAPSHAPRIGNQVSQGRPFAGEALRPQQQQQQGGGQMNPAQLMMLMRMLQQSGTAPMGARESTVNNVNTAAGTSDPMAQGAAQAGDSGLFSWLGGLFPGAIGGGGGGFSGGTAGSY
jgi:hypothetical protein